MGSEAHTPGRLTHLDDQGKARMVDVTGKPQTHRRAEARCVVRTRVDTEALLSAPPGGVDLIASAQVAGMQAAKVTAGLIPLCHPIRLEGIEVEIHRRDGSFEVIARAEITERTGVEMEALTACMGAALTLVAACLELDPETAVDELAVWHKSGGRSGTWARGVRADEAFD